MQLLGSSILRNLSFCSLEIYLYMGLTPLWYLHDTPQAPIFQDGMFHKKPPEGLGKRRIYRSAPMWYDKYVGRPVGRPRLSRNPKKKHVIANQSADWCGDPVNRTKTSENQPRMFENPRDCHVGLCPPRNDVLFRHAQALRHSPEGLFLSVVVC